MTKPHAAINELRPGFFQRSPHLLHGFRRDLRKPVRVFQSPQRDDRNPRVLRDGCLVEAQKGTGGARHGSRNAPIFVGGGVAHGPHPHSHAHALPKKVRALAMKHALSSKVKDEALIVLDGFDGEKTKDLVAQLKALNISNALFIGGAEVNEKFAKAARNIPNIDVLPLAGLNVYDVLRRKTLVMSREAVEGVNARFAEAEKA